MPLPLIIVIGPAGSGKDTVAAMIAKNYGGIVMAQADIMKRFARDAFGFTEEQLWGPSDNRNALDTRFANYNFRFDVRHDVSNFGFRWVNEINDGSFDNNKAAEALYRWADNLIDGAEDDGGLTPRKCLQTLGTEFGRNLSKEVWTTYARKIAMKLLGGHGTYTAQGGFKESTDNHNFVIISDGRFRNEIVGVKALGGVAIKIHSPSADNSAVEKAGIAGHRSETEQLGVPNHFFDAVVHNDKAKGLATLEYIVKDTVETLYLEPHFFYGGVSANFGG